jgi:hypothetical protein
VLGRRAGPHPVGALSIVAALVYSMFMTTSLDALPPEELQVLARIRLAVTAGLVALAGATEPDLAARASKRPFVLRLSAPGLPPAFVVSEDGALASYSGGARPPRGRSSLTLFFPSARACARVLAGGAGTPLPIFRGRGAFSALRFFRAAATRAPALIADPKTDVALRARLLAEAALRGLAEVGNADPAVAARMAHIPEGVVAFEVEGAFSLGLAKRGGLISLSADAPAKPNAVLSFRDAEAACAVLSGARQAAVALGTEEVTLRGLLPLVQGLFAILDRLGDYLAVNVKEAAL